MSTTKFEKATLPTREEAITMAEEREAWAIALRNDDKNGTAKEFELTALLLRRFAETSE